MNFTLNKILHIIHLSEKSDIKVRLKTVYKLDGYATFQNGVVAMIKYILRIIFLIFVFLIAFTLKVK